MNLTKMLGFRQPTSLEELCLGRLCQQLDSTCRKLQVDSQESSVVQVLACTKQTIRPYYVNSLSSRIRSRIIEETSRMLYGPAADGSMLISGPAPLFLLAILLGPDIKHLKVNLCCYYGCSHQSSLLNLIGTEGVGLQSLELARSALLRLESKLFRAAMMNLRNLLNLTLRNIANDSILEVIGKTCPKLVFLDVASSRQVSDMGIKRLLMQVELRDRSPSMQSLRRRNHRLHEENRESSWSRVKTLMSKLKMRNRKDIRDDEHGVLLTYCENRNHLCETLRILNVANTAVSSAGVLFALTNLPNLESLAEYDHMGLVVEIMQEAKVNVNVPFRLTQARSNRATYSTLELLARACPKLEKLYLSEPCHTPEALRLFPFVTSLTIHNAPVMINWFYGFSDYLRTNGKYLQELSVRVSMSETPRHMDVREIFVNCPNLVKLSQDGAGVDWLDGPDPPPLTKLRKINLGLTVNAKTVVKVLSLAPELVSAHLHSCFDLTDEHFENLLIPSEVPRRRFDDTPRKGSMHNLQCFYIYEASHISAKTILNMFKCCKHLGRIANLANWGLNCEGVKELREKLASSNLDVDICPSSHRFWGNCTY